MKEQIEKFIRNSEDKREARASLMFIVCYNLLDDNCPYTSGQIREMIMDALDNIEE